MYWFAFNAEVAKQNAVKITLPSISTRGDQLYSDFYNIGCKMGRAGFKSPGDIFQVSSHSPKKCMLGTGGPSLTLGYCECLSVYISCAMPSELWVRFAH